MWKKVGTYAQIYWYLYGGKRRLVSILIIYLIFNTLNIFLIRDIYEFIRVTALVFYIAVVDVALHVAKHNYLRSRLIRLTKGGNRNEKSTKMG